MDLRIVIYSFILFCTLPVARLRSIDQIIQDVEIEFEESDTGPMSKFPSRVWYDYEVKGRKEELVKLQLDMIMTKELWDTVIDTNIALPERQKRNAVKDKARLWPRRIPYILNDNFNISDKFKLLMAMDHWEEHTCLEFVEANVKKDYDIIEFVPASDVCESFLGRMQGKQSLSLAPQCMYKEVIVHEIGHALGLYHEHMRADRDDYVTVHYNHIKDINHDHRQFDKLNANSFDSYNKPYDYESIMHYGKLFLSINRTANLITVEPKNVAYLDVIGEAPSLSFYDVKIVSEMYDCSAGCKHKICPGNGFLGKNCECYCTGENMYDIVLCNKTENCGKPNISLSEYLVCTKDYGHEITNWDEEATTFPHGKQFIVEHLNNTCGLSTWTFNCSDGQWEGELPVCENACLLKFSSDYIVKDATETSILTAGDRVVSADGIIVSCKKHSDNPGEYIECFDGVWDRNISEVICIEGNCGKPNISLSEYKARTTDCEREYIKNWDKEIATFPQGTQFVVEHLNTITCGTSTRTFNCSDGQWEGELPVCEKACLLEFSSDYIVKDATGTSILTAGDRIVSADRIIVSCKNSRRDSDNREEYIKCFDGIWNKSISDVICIKEHPLCPMVVNSQLTGSFDDGFKVNCLEGHELEVEGEPDNSFTCSWEGKWEPVIPLCNPANCSIPRSENPGELYNSDGDVVQRGSDVRHGYDVTLSCPKGHAPDVATLSCQYGKWISPEGKFPECVYVTCPKPTVVGARYKPKQEDYVYGDKVRVGRCNGILALEGSRELKCQKFGNWSDTAVCKPFCVDGQVKFEVMKNKEFQKAIWHKKFGLASYSACERKCRQNKRFLCASFVYGFEKGRHVCRIHPQNPNEMSAYVKKRMYWTMGVRECIRN